MNTPRWTTGVWFSAIAFALVGLAACASPGTVAGGSASELSGARLSPAASSASARPAFSGPASSASASPARTAVATGSFTGVARLYGGPLTTAGVMADDGTPYPGLTLAATQNGQVVASVITGPDGRFLFTLPPGSYVVTGCLGLPIVVAAGQILDKDVSCPIP